MIKKWETYREEALKMAEEGYILIFGEFCPELEEIVMECLLIAMSKGKKQATLLINSFGGKNHAYNSIKGTMAVSGLKFTGIVLGYAMSNGFHILQLCHKRVATKTSTVMFHFGTAQFSNNEIAAVRRGETWPIDHMLQKEMLEAEAVSKRTKVALKTLIGYAEQERDFTGQEAINAGFLDEVIDDLPAEIVIPKLEQA